MAGMPAGGDSIPESVDEAVAVALDEVILPRLQLRLQEERQPAEPRLRAVSLLGWTGKALAMRRHPRAGKPLDTVLAYLEAASLDLAAAQEEGGAAAEPTPGELGPSEATAKVAVPNLFSALHRVLRLSRHPAACCGVIIICIFDCSVRELAMVLISLLLIMVTAIILARRTLSQPAWSLSLCMTRTWRVHWVMCTGRAGREEIQGNGMHPEQAQAIQEEPDLENQWDDAFDAEEARAMARALAQVLGSSSGVARLDAAVHAVGGILWQQKVGSSCWHQACSFHPRSGACLPLHSAWHLLGREQRNGQKEPLCRH